jgi:hypothetical protein
MKRNEVYGRTDCGDFEAERSRIEDGRDLPQNGISEATLYNWKAKYSGMGISDVQKLKLL